MKKLITILVILLTGLTFAQESNNVSIFSSPGTYIDFGHRFKNDGFNIGVNYEHQNKLIYIGSQLFYFSELNDITYIHLIGRFGFHKEFGRFNKFRVYFGGRGGGVYRENIYSLIGGEIGVQYTFRKGLFFTLAGSRNIRTDSKLWSDRDNFTTNSVDFGVGIRF